MAIADRMCTISIDAELVRRVAKGDEAAAQELYLSHCDAVLQYVLRRCRATIEDAEELVNDTFVAAVKLAPTFESNCTIMTWLCSLARYRIIDFHRVASAAKRIPENHTVRIDDASRRAFRDVRDPSNRLEDLVDQLDRVRIVKALLHAMTPEQRDAVLMRYVEGFSVPEIGRIMNRSAKAVERLLDRAKAGPRREILKWLGNESFRALCFDLLIL